MYAADQTRRCPSGATQSLACCAQSDAERADAISVERIHALLEAAHEAHIRGLALHLQASSELLQRTLHMLGLSGRSALAVPANDRTKR